MLRFLKNIFAKKEAEREEVALDKLGNWFEGNTKGIFNSLDEKTGHAKSKIRDEIKKCAENLEILKNAELKNPNIPIRAKQAMEGNREAYIKRIEIFLNNINLNKTDYDELMDFCRNFSEELDILARSTLKSYHILQQFLANESSAIALNIKNMDNFVKELKNSIADSSLENIESIKNEISNLKIKIKRKDDLKEELDNKLKDIVELKKSKESLEEEIANFKKSGDFVNFLEFQGKRELIKKEIENHKDNFLHSFSILEKAFKKFSRIAFEDKKTVEDYASFPLNALMKDSEFKIIKILANLEKNIYGNKLDLDEKKRQKSLDEIKKLDKEFFISFLKAHNELKEKLNKINKEIWDNEAEKNEIELNGKFNSANLKIEKLESNIGGLKQEFEKINIQELKNGLQENINNALSKNIVIS